MDISVKPFSLTQSKETVIVKDSSDDMWFLGSDDEAEQSRFSQSEIFLEEYEIESNTSEDRDENNLSEEEDEEDGSESPEEVNIYSCFREDLVCGTL